MEEHKERRIAGNWNSRRKPGRPAKYLQLKEWPKVFVNDLHSLNQKVKLLLWLNGGIALAVIGKLVVDFFWS